MLPRCNGHDTRSSGDLSDNALMADKETSLVHEEKAKRESENSGSLSLSDKLRILASKEVLSPSLQSRDLSDQHPDTKIELPRR